MAVSPTLTDTLTDGNAASLTLNAGPTFTNASASSLQGTLTVGEIATYTATYTVNQQALDSGSVVNTVLATAKDGPLFKLTLLPPASLSISVTVRPLKVTLPSFLTAIVY